MRRQERPKIEVKNGTSNGPGAGGDSNSNIAIENVESDIDELSDQMNEMTRRMLRIEEERQVSFPRARDNMNRIPTVKLKIPWFIFTFYIFHIFFMVAYLLSPNRCHSIAKIKNYNLNLTEVRDSDFKNAFPGIFNFTVVILRSSLNELHPPDSGVLRQWMTKNWRIFNAIYFQGL